MRIQRTSRPGFTITEMLVATALILFLMAIISQAFGSATRTFNELRTIGQMQERLRTTSSIVRKDLTTEHFAGPFIPGRSGPRLGDQRLDQAGWVPPTKGYFEIRQGSASQYEGADGENIASSRATDHIMRFTMQLPDLPAPELFCAAAPAATPGNAFQTGQAIYYSRWAEVVYFLASSNGTTANGSQLFSLRRRMRLLASETTSAFGSFPNANAAQLFANQYPEIAFQVVQISAAPVAFGIRVMGPDLVTVPFNRIPASVAVNAVGQTGDDVLMTDVLSFEIKLAWINNPALNGFASPLHAPLPSPPSLGVAAANTDAPYADLQPVAAAAFPLNPSYAGARVFDSWYKDPATADGIDWDRPQAVGGTAGFVSRSTGQPPMRINVRSIQIKLRVYDSKAEKARQVTIAQEL